MEDMNVVMLIGRLTRDAELKYMNNGTAISTFAIAVNRRRKNGDEYKDEVSFFDLALFGQKAENLNQYLTKGQQVCVQGKLKQDTWEKDGQKHSKTAIEVWSTQLLGGKPKQQTDDIY